MNTNLLGNEIWSILKGFYCRCKDHRGRNQALQHSILLRQLDPLFFYIITHVLQPITTLISMQGWIVPLHFNFEIRTEHRLNNWIKVDWYGNGYSLLLFLGISLLVSSLINYWRFELNSFEINFCLFYQFVNFSEVCMKANFSIDCLIKKTALFDEDLRSFHTRIMIESSKSLGV